MSLYPCVSKLWIRISPKSAKSPLDRPEDLSIESISAVLADIAPFSRNLFQMLRGIEIDSRIKEANAIDRIAVNPRIEIA